MLVNYENKKLKLNAPLRNNAAGSIVRIKVDKTGVPIDPYWRRRLKDAKIDNCCEIVSVKKIKKLKEVVTNDSDS